MAKHATSPLSGNYQELAILQEVLEAVPRYTGASHKGQHGKVGVLGGCREYTGAPYFAAMSALKVGADLSHVFCTSDASLAIKSYSPELIVLPYVPDTSALGAGRDVAARLAAASTEAHAAAVDSACERIHEWLGRLGCLVVGPGLGADPVVVATSKAVMRAARDMQLPMVVDGSALNFVAKDPGLVAGYSSCILTPNLMEFGRVAAGVGLQLEGSIGAHWQQQTEALAQKLGGVTVLSKGPWDVISDGTNTVSVTVPSGLRRAGGQGDVLAGVLAAFVCWLRLRERSHPQQAWSLNPMCLAAFGGSAVTRSASAAAFEERGRGMLAGDLIHCLPRVVDRLVGL